MFFCLLDNKLLMSAKKLLEDGYLMAGYFLINYLIIDILLDEVLKTICNVYLFSISASLSLPG